MISLDVNGTEHRLDGAPETPLLYVLRGELGCMPPNTAAASVSAAPAP